VGALSYQGQQLAFDFSLSFVHIERKLPDGNDPNVTYYTLHSSIQQSIHRLIVWFKKQE
jgi:hypothetical protein